MSETTIKVAPYEGFHKDCGSTVAYAVVGNNIIFSADEDRAKKLKITSTIQAVEQVIFGIAKVENIDWGEYTFFDLQTNVGYPGNYGTDYVELSRLEFELRGDDSLRVKKWHRIFWRGYGRWYVGEDYNNPYFPVELVEKLLERASALL